MDQSPLRILVTGSSGFVGQHVVRHLASLGHKVIGYDLRPPDEPFPDGSIFLCGDIRSDRLPNENIDAVVHLAALAGVRPSIDRPHDYISTNVDGTVRLLEHCRAHGINRFVLASSSSVYGDTKGRPSTESDPVMPMSPYALSKVQAEQWGELYSRLHGIRFVALRFFTVWGHGQRKDLALAAFTQALLRNEHVRVNGDGHQRRDLTHVSDVARAVGLALRYQGADFAAFNIGTGRNHSVLEMVKQAERFTGKSATIEHHPAHPTDVPETRANPVKSAVCLGWRAEVQFPGSEGVSREKV